MRKNILLLLLTLFSFSAIHAEKDGNIEWNLSNDGTLTISGSGDMPNYSKNINNVTTVPWFPQRYLIHTVVIKHGVTNIGNYAFFQCTNLTSITIANSVTSIGEEAFFLCQALTSIAIPNSVTSIGEFAFSDCSGLTSITIPNSVTSIGGQAFAGCKALTSIAIPNSVTSIGDGAFSSCSGLTSITIPNSVTSIGERAFCDCSKLTSITIPNSVTSIGEYAFRDCSGLTSITIPNSVTSIGKAAFLNAGLISITIPNSVTNIGICVFYGCSALSSIIVEEGNVKYDSRDNCNAIIETKSNTLIAGCKKTVIPNSVTSIGSYAFYGCSSLTSIAIPNSVTSIVDYAFAECSGLTSITIPNSVTSIGNRAFYSCSWLASITIGNSVMSIGNEAFAHSELTSISIPNSVTSIGYRAFFMTPLSYLTFKGSTPPEFGEECFGEYTIANLSHGTISVPSTSIDAYKKALEGFGLSGRIYANPKLLYLTDNASYTQDSQVEGAEVSYTRNFTNTNWQALYLPFSLNYEDWKDDFEIAYINAISQEDNNDDGKIDKTVLEFVKMTGGSTAPNTPYLIRAKKTGEKTISVENTTVYPAEKNSIDCSTTTATFTFTGTYNDISSYLSLMVNTFYVIDGDKLSRATISKHPKAFQWYMTIKSRNDDYAEYDSNTAKEITISVLDDEEATGIRQMQMTNDELPVYNSSVYDMNGRKINENSLKPGMYIKNGRKIIVK